MKMIFAIMILFAGLQANANPNQAHAGSFGLGGMVGSMISGTGKYWISDKHAIAFGLGYWHPAFTAYGDFLWRLPALFGRGTQFGRETDAYIGGGLGVGFWSNYCKGTWRCKDDDTASGTAVFVKGMFGAEWMPRAAPIGVFAELGPAIEVVPVTGGMVYIGTGSRYYF